MKPATKLWGAQTELSLKNFPIGTPSGANSGATPRTNKGATSANGSPQASTPPPMPQLMPLPLIRALGIQKQAAALANRQLGLLPKKVGDAIATAAQEVASGKWDNQFPLVIWQTGSGTQTNMNANEVIASRANQLLGANKSPKKTSKGLAQKLAKYKVHPNDHCNLAQSSNDTFPTAMHIATVGLVRAKLNPALKSLIKGLEAKQRQFSGTVKMGRTHLQDAVPITLDQVFSAYVAGLSKAEARLKPLEQELYYLAQGGTAVGTGLLASPKFATTFVAHLKKLTALPFKTAPNKFAAIATHDDLVAYSGGLVALATTLTKIAGDIRLLASGPRGGLGELVIPANEPGSSIMPGKVNPTQAESLIQICAQVVGNHTALTLGAGGGQFELNAAKPLIIKNLLESIVLLADGMASFNLRLIKGIKANKAKLAQNVETSLMLVTALVPHIGYDKATSIAKFAHSNNLTLKQAAHKLGLVSGADFDRWVRPENMLKPRG